MSALSAHLIKLKVKLSKCAPVHERDDAEGEEVKNAAKEGPYLTLLLGIVNQQVFDFMSGPEVVLRLSEYHFV